MPGQDDWIKIGLPTAAPPIIHKPPEDPKR